MTVSNDVTYAMQLIYSYYGRDLICHPYVVALGCFA